MSRSLFDPGKVRGGKKPEGDGDSPLTVTGLSSLISGALTKGIPGSVRVAGELSNFNDRTHWYFRLKDAESVVDCVMFASSAAKLKMRPENGMQLLCSGRVEHYARQGRTQLYVTSMRAVGEGDLERKLRELVEELRSLGWLEAERKRPLPVFPRRIAIVTSRTGAALQDVRETMRRRCPAVGAVVVDVLVQGAGAAPGIARALGWLSRNHERLGVDAILLTRGGGSLEDLWAFNERAVAEAIVRSAVPVVAAIGHETDTTVAELVADHRASTPTQAAMALTPDRAALAEQASQLRGSLERTARGRIERERRNTDRSLERMRSALERRASQRQLRLERIATRLARCRPEAVFARRRARLESIEPRLHACVRGALGRVDLLALRDDLEIAVRGAVRARHERIAALERELVIASPQSVLARGYSVTLDASGRAIASASDVRSGERVTTRVRDGSFGSIVEGEATSESAPEPAPVPARRAPRQARSRRRPDRDQMDLFGAGG